MPLGVVPNATLRFHDSIYALRDCSGLPQESILREDVLNQIVWWNAKGYDTPDPKLTNYSDRTVVTE